MILSIRKTRANRQFFVGPFTILLDKIHFSVRKLILSNRQLLFLFILDSYRE